MNPGGLCDICHEPTQSVNYAYCDDCLGELEADEDEEED
jgi:hypothetical protein